MDFVKSPQPTLPRVSAKVAEEANTGGATNEQYIYEDQNYKKTTITKLPTDFVKILKPTLPPASFKVAEEASTDGATNVQRLYEDQNYKEDDHYEIAHGFS